MAKIKDPEAAIASQVTPKYTPHGSAVLECEEYSERVVGFVDILGFGDLVRRADRDSVLRAKIVAALNIVRSVKPPIPGDTDLRVQNFSDSLIISARDTPDGFWHLLMAIDAVANQLLQMGVFMRGGWRLEGCFITMNSPSV